MKKLLVLTLLLPQLTMAQGQDPLYKLQWGLENTGQKVFRAESEIHREEVIGTPGKDINLPPAQELAGLANGKEVIVAVIDSGIDMHHPEFEGRLYKGYDFLNNEDMLDDTGHGTHVAGIIAANTDGRGTQGMTPNAVKILPLKVLNSKVNSFIFENKRKERRLVTDIFANALIYAIEAKAHVINMSLGWPQIINTPKVVKALDVAYERNITVVAASGNNNKDVPTWPCGHPAVICVGAMDGQGALTEFSNHGGKVDLVAPGEWIVSTIPRNLESRSLRIHSYDAKNGSSQAAPFVSGAVALLKLQNPDMSVDEIKARLYSTAKPIPSDKDGRFVRFGALSVRDALAAKQINLASVLVKELMTITVSDDGKFSHTLPLEILGDSKGIPVVTLSGLKADIQVSGQEIQISGKVTNLNLDSDHKVIFRTTLEGRTTETPVTVSFAREVESTDMISTTIPKIHPSQLLTIQGNIKGSKLTQVSVEDLPSSDFHGYIMDQKPNDPNIFVTSLQINAGQSAKSVSIPLRDTSVLLTVFEKDVNGDGKNDLVFYGINGKQDHLHLTFTTLEGEPLFGEHSRWEMPITTFEGLPLLKGEGNFSWIEHSSFLGKVQVPYYHKAWLMPDEDNSQRLIDHEPKNKADTRLYFWEPYLEGERTLARPRVIDSVAFKKNLRKELKAGPRDTVKIERLLPQSQEERRLGHARHLVSVGEGGFNRKVYIMRVTGTGKHSITPHADNDAFLSGNNVLMSRSLEDHSLQENSFLMALLDRSSARVKPLIEGATSPAWNLSTSGWSNPFFEMVATFGGRDRRTLFFESRYHVYVYDQQGNGAPISARLPINRDSSIPGVNFSETLQGVLIKDQEGNQPGVAINSTWIYGDRLTTMVSRQGEFVRPIALSVVIPKNCVPLKSQMVPSIGHSAYTMLCQVGNGVELSFYPLQLP